MVTPHASGLTGLIRCLTVLVAVTVLMAGAAATAAERITREIKVGDMVRTYAAYLPDTASSERSWPVLVVFHPGLADGSFMERTTTFHGPAREAGFVVVYPDGFRRTWNSGDCCGPARRRGIDDLGFFDAIMADLSTLIPVEERAFLTGFSNGAIMAYHIACKMPDRVAAIAPFASAYPGTACRHGNVPVFHIHGELDRSAPVEGGVTEIKWFDTRRQQVPAKNTVEQFGAKNGCDLNDPESWHSEFLKTDCQKYKRCEGGETTICVVERLGHTWPGAPVGKSALGQVFGPERTDIDGTGAVLAFFNRVRQTQ